MPIHFGGSGSPDMESEFLDALSSLVSRHLDLTEEISAEIPEEISAEIPEEIPEHRCPRCGSTNSNRQEVYWGNPTNDRRVCRSCFSEWNVCRSDTHNEDLSNTQYGHEVCYHCLILSGWSQCADCNSFADHAQNAVGENDGHRRICNECASGGRYEDCFRCGTFMHQGSNAITRDIWGNAYCNDCRDGNLIRCSACSGWRRRHASGGCNCGLVEPCTCSRCRLRREREAELERERSSSSFINEWNYRPEPKFHGVGPLYLGMELEIETGDHKTECRNLVEKYCTTDLCYLKYDGSIVNGFELVTHPMSFDWARESFPWEMLEALYKEGAGVSRNVGLHVHLSRKGFKSETHVYKWMKFIYRNSAQVTNIAGRESYQWAAFDPDDREAIKYYCKGDQSSSRYRAINVNNEETFEMRMFKSSLDPHQVKAVLGLADASVEYTRQLTTKEILQGGWNWSAFYAWLSDKPKYTDLRERMEELSCVS